MTNELVFSAPPIREAELSTLIARRAERYTMGDRSSVPIETFEMLTVGVLMTLSLAVRDGNDPSEPYEKLFESGQKCLNRRVRRGKLLVHELAAFEPCVMNEGYRETAASLSAALKRYDPSFFPQVLPAEITYPLLIPVSETLTGIELFNAYITQLLSENRLLNRFDRNAAAAYLNAYTAHDGGLLINMPEPILEQAIGCVLAGTDARLLTLNEGERERAFAHRERLDAAAERLCGVLGASERERQLIDAVSRSLCARLAAIPEGETAAGFFRVFCGGA